MTTTDGPLSGSGCAFAPSAPLRAAVRLAPGRPDEPELLRAVGRIRRQLVQVQVLERAGARDAAVVDARREADREKLLAELHRVAVASHEVHVRGEDAAQAGVHPPARAQDREVVDR